MNISDQEYAEIQMQEAHWNMNDNWHGTPVNFAQTRNGRDFDFLCRVSRAKQRIVTCLWLKRHDFIGYHSIWYFREAEWNQWIEIQVPQTQISLKTTAETTKKNKKTAWKLFSVQMPNFFSKGNRRTKSNKEWLALVLHLNYWFASSKPRIIEWITLSTEEGSYGRVDLPGRSSSFSCRGQVSLIMSPWLPSLDNTGHRNIFHFHLIYAANLLDEEEIGH